MSSKSLTWGEADSLASTDVSGDSASTEEDEIVILCELVGARHLARHDKHGGELENRDMRPFCVVKYGDKIIHRTRSAEENGNNPIWTVSTKSLFLIKANPQQMTRQVLNISLFTKRKDSLPVSLISTKSLSLGQVNMDSTTILSHCDEERFNLNIEDELGGDASARGTLSLRLRIATRSDRQIVHLFQTPTSKLNETSKRDFANLILEDNGDSTQIDMFRKGGNRPLATLITETPESEVAQSSFVNALNHAFSSNVIRDHKTGLTRLRVKPSPDPELRVETEFMTAQEISTETRRPSRKWVEAGSGTLGKLYLEILACHDLPNVDIGEAVGNVTDSFVCAVYEDTCAMTDVIDDELCPHWLPWTQRAFCFGIMHPASILYLGVFDYDLGLGNHEPLGRVAVNVSNLQRNTVYTVKYNLYKSSNVTDRIANGSISIRLRVEYFDEKAALMAAIKPRTNIYVNVRKEKSFKVVRFTCFGEYDKEDKFDLTVTRSYINEIFEYKSALSYTFWDTMKSLVFWRGQVKFFGIMLPIHSLTFFFAALTLVERPSMIVPFTLLGVAWSLLASLTLCRQHPSPWHRPPSFWHYLSLLQKGVSAAPITSIKENEGHDAAQAYEGAWKKRLEEDLLVAEKKAALQQQINTIGDDTISTKVLAGGIPLDLVVRLGRYQGIVGRVCRSFRLIKIIVTWEEGVVTFLITAGFLVAGLLSLFLPWAFILTWTGRLVVWAFFGPHMKLVDLFLRSSSKKDVTLRKLVERFHEQSIVARLRREEAVKLKDIKATAFGKYSIQVPSFNLGESI
jgi:hypothetical protein